MESSYPYSVPPQPGRARLRSRTKRGVRAKAAITFVIEAVILVGIWWALGHFAGIDLSLIHI